MITREQVQRIKNRFGIIGHSSEINHAVWVAMQTAPANISVLITGENGVGKESFSKIIHGLSRRRNKNFMAINCGAIPEGTIDAELFGHEKGAFTGALESRKGYFEETDQGTLFLDEVGEMPLITQARLLRVLESGEYLRVGSSQVRKAEVRLLAATNTNLEEAIAKKKFREDLYYRLNTVPLHVPPLRERGRDILLLFRKFSSTCAEKYQRSPIQLTEEAENILLNYSFPGNVRQLKNIVEQLSILQEENIIEATTLANCLPNHTGPKNELCLINHTTVTPEKDAIYPLIFSLKKEVDELRSAIVKLFKGASPQKVIEDHHLLSQTKKSFEPFSSHASSEILNEHTAPQETAYEIDGPKINEEEKKLENPLYLTSDVIEVSAGASLKDQEYALIKHALQHSEKRKEVARKLGISERTLYRKIKNHGLEKI